MSSSSRSRLFLAFVPRRERAITEQRLCAILQAREISFDEWTYACLLVELDEVERRTAQQLKGGAR